MTMCGNQRSAHLIRRFTCVGIALNVGGGGGLASMQETSRESPASLLEYLPDFVTHAFYADSGASAADNALYRDLMPAADDISKLRARLSRVMHGPIAVGVRREGEDTTIVRIIIVAQAGPSGEGKSPSTDVLSNLRALLPDALRATSLGDRLGPVVVRNAPDNTLTLEFEKRETRLHVGFRDGVFLGDTDRESVVDFVRGHQRHVSLRRDPAVLAAVRDRPTLPRALLVTDTETAADAMKGLASIGGGVNAWLTQAGVSRIVLAEYPDRMRLGVAHASAGRGLASVLADPANAAAHLDLLSSEAEFFLSCRLPESMDADAFLEGLGGVAWNGARGEGKALLASVTGVEFGAEALPILSRRWTFSGRFDGADRVASATLALGVADAPGLRTFLSAVRAGSPSRVISNAVVGGIVDHLVTVQGRVVSYAQVGDALLISDEPHMVVEALARHSTPQGPSRTRLLDQLLAQAPRETTLLAALQPRAWLKTLPGSSRGSSLAHDRIPDPPSPPSKASEDETPFSAETRKRSQPDTTVWYQRFQNPAVQRWAQNHALVLVAVVPGDKAATIELTSAPPPRQGWTDLWSALSRVLGVTARDAE